MAEEKTFSAKQVATRIGTEAKILRKFFRDPKSGYTPVGQGGRYDFPEAEITKIKAAFDVWNAGKNKRNRPTNAERALAEKAGLVPKKARGTSATPAAPRRKSNEPAPSPLDEDTLQDRLRMTIGERARRRGLVPNQQGRLVESPELMARIRERAERNKTRTPAEVEASKEFFNQLLSEVIEK